MKLRVKPAKLRALIDWLAFTDIPFISLTVATVIGLFALTTLLLYISYYAEVRGITSTEMAFYVVPIFNAGWCFGRVIHNAISVVKGPLNLIVPGATIVGIPMFCMMAIKTEATLIDVVLLGFFSGVFIALPPVCFIALTEDKSKIGTRIGMGFGIEAFGVLAGGPGASVTLGTMNPLNWHGLWIFGGVMVHTAGFMYAGVRLGKGGLKVNAKV